MDKTDARLTDSLPKWAKEFVPPAKRAPSPTEVLKKLLAGKAVPTLAVVIILPP